MSFNSIFDRPDFVDDLMNLAERLEPGCLDNLEQEIWDLAREHELLPHFGNICMDILFTRLESIICHKYKHYQPKIDYAINSRDSHFWLNDKDITSSEQFFDYIAELEEEYLEDEHDGDDA